MHILVQSALKNSRIDFNNRFNLLHSANPKLQSKEFLHCFNALAIPCIEALVPRHADKIPFCLDKTYDAFLELFAGNVFDKIPGTRSVWSEILPTLIDLFARDPERLILICTNTIFNFSKHAYANVNRWIGFIKKFPAICAEPSCSDIEKFTRFGQVAAWASGMAQYREAALEIAVCIEPELMAVIFETDIKSVSELEKIIQKMRQNPWLLPKEALSDSKSATNLQLIRKVAGFRGLNGTFISPPKVSSIDNRIIAYDHNTAWIIYADCYGTHLQKTELDESVFKKSVKASKIPDELSKSCKLEINNFVKAQHLYAASSQNSHFVFLFGER